MLAPDQDVWKFLISRGISVSRLPMLVGTERRNQCESLRWAISKAPSWAKNHAMTRAIVAGIISRGGRRKADLPSVSRAAGMFPDFAWRRGLMAHTYPVRKANMVTPIRPWKGKRIKGSWSSWGAAFSLSRGDQRL